MLRLSSMISLSHTQRTPAQPSPTSAMQYSFPPTNSLYVKVRPSTTSLRCTALHRPLHRPISFLSIEELLKDPNITDRLEDFGGFALEVALNDHLFKRYPAHLLTQLREANLSRENLTRVAERLESARLIYVMNVEDNEKDFTKQYVVGVLGFAACATHKFWKGKMNELKETGRVEEIKRVGMKELEKGFRAGLYNYALQVAGLIYFENEYDTEKFWERFKEYMEPIVSPQDLDSRSAAAKMFEEEMKGVIEGVPLFQSVMLTFM